MNLTRRSVLVPSFLVSSLAAVLLPLTVCWSLSARGPDLPSSAHRSANGTTGRTAAGPDVDRTAAVGAGYTAKAGTRLHFALHLATGVTMRGAPAEPAANSRRPLDVTASGTLEVVVLDRRQDEMLVSFRLPDATITTLGAATAETRDHTDGLQQALRQGFDVRMDVAGRPRALRCPAEWTAPQRTFARALLSTFRCELQNAAEWTSHFADAMGEHTFAYRAAPADSGLTVRRERTGFAPRHQEPERNPEVRTNGVATGHFASGVGWLTTAEVDDAVAWNWLGGALRLEAWQRGTLRWHRSDTVPVVPAWDGGFVDADGAPPAAPAAGDPLRTFWRDRLRGRDVPALLRELAALLAQSLEPSQERHELVQLLAELVRQEPARAAELAAGVQAARLCGQLAADVLAALGMAGHASAQAALGAVFENGLVEAGLRQAALDSMFQIEQPSAALVDVLQRTLRGKERLDAFAGSAMLVLGALANKNARAADGQGVVVDLLALEAQARQQGLEPVWFEALGNTGDPAVLPLATSMLAQPDPVARALGLTALRRVALPAADELVRSAARDDAAAEVRRQATEQIAAADAPWTTAALVERTRLDADVEVRRSAYVGLVLRARTDERARAALRQRLADEPAAELRDLLRTWAQGT